MAKRQRVTEAEQLDAIAFAVTCAIFWAPESLLVTAGTERRQAACQRLALRVLMQLAKEGYGEGRRRKRGEGLAADIAAGIARAGDCFLVVLPNMRRGNGRVLDALGQHIGTGILAVMKENGTRLGRINLFGP